MLQTCYHLKKEAHLSPLPCDHLPARFADGEDDYWQEIETITPGELEAIVKSYDLHPFMAEDILNLEHSTLIDRYAGGVYIEFPANFDDSNSVPTYLSIILLPHLIVTIRRGNIPAMQKVLDLLQHEVRLPIGRTITVLYYILNHFIDNNMLAAQKLRNQIGTLELAFAENLDEISLTTTTVQKQLLRVLTNIAEDQRYCVMSIKDNNSPMMDFSGYESYIRDLVSDTYQALRSLGRSEERVLDLQRSYQLTMHDASDKRLRILTIISAIFMPMTLLTGFFGMNFRGMILLE